MSTGVIVARIALSIAVASYAEDHGLSGWGYGIGAFVFSPLIAWIVAAISK